ncbi:hypothetical protein BaRGS_00029611 [Batillaria attramentaria]|uniref:GAR domain-containing protein n=1 Tax=Batillaria attramentaria TaxID=370345 RepID=A0ABD0JX59_9CAEN
MGAKVGKACPPFGKRKRQPETEASDKQLTERDGQEKTSEPPPQEFECKCREYIAKHADEIYDTDGRHIKVTLESGKHLLVKVGGGWELFEDYLECHEPYRMTCKERDCSSSLQDGRVTVMLADGWAVLEKRPKILRATELLSPKQRAPDRMFDPYVPEFHFVLHAHCD